MPEINLDDVDNEKHALVVLQVVQRHHALVKANRALLVVVFLLMAAVFAMGLFLLPRNNVIETAKANQAANVNFALQNPAISAEINTLKGQMFGLVSGSIESKLRSLEENIKRGSVADSLNTIQDLRSDVKVLGAYSTAEAQANIQQQAVPNQQLIKEMTDLKDLVYLTFISCGLMIAAVAGVWFRHRRLTHHRAYKGYLSRHD